ncbi:MAG: STAS domain-containing protein [Rhodocyclaceae bacterium]
MAAPETKEVAPSRLEVEEELTIYHAAQLKEALLAGLSQGEALEVDLSQVAEIDSAGVQLLVLLKREAAAAGKRLSLVGHSPAVLSVLDLYNMSGYFGDPLVISSRPSAQP